MEFFDENYIFTYYVPDGITECDNRKGYITNDTHMSIFTADAVIGQYNKNSRSDMDDYVQSIYNGYLDWFYTQTKEVNSEHEKSTLLKVKELYSRRTPGSSCLSAIRLGRIGTIEQSINYSKGCGGLTRTAPIALIFWI